MSSWAAKDPYCFMMSDSLLSKVLIRVANVFEVFAILSMAATLFALYASHVWWMDNCTHFRWQYTVATAIGSVIWFKRKRFSLTTAAGVVCLWNFILLIPLYLPFPIKKDSSRPTLSILLFNVLSSNPTPDRVIQYLQKTPADIVILEEVNQGWISRLEPWSGELTHRFEEPREDNFGMAIYSRLPVKSFKWDPISNKLVPSFSAKVILDGNEVEFLAMHPLPPSSYEYWSARNNQLESVAQWCSEGKGERLVVGDLNATPWCPFFKKLVHDGRLTHARQGFGLLNSWPAGAPALYIPLDTLLVQEKLKIVRVERGPELGSDHYPMLFEIQINN